MNGKEATLCFYCLEFSLAGIICKAAAIPAEPKSKGWKGDCNARSFDGTGR